jgi:hypothetical protein
MSKSTEPISLEALNAIGGTTYNHSMQMIKADDQYFLGDDYEEYSAIDALCRSIMEHPKHFYSIQGKEIVSLSECYEFGSTFIEVMSKDDMDDEHTYVDEVHFDYVDIVVLVNYPSKLNVTKKDNVELK